MAPRRVPQSRWPLNWMSGQGALVRFAAVLAGVVPWASACGDGATEAPVSFPTTVTVTPATVGFTALGETVQLSAQVRDQDGRIMEGFAVSWESTDAAIATVDANGLVTAAGNGSAAVAASAWDASGSAAVTVAQAVSEVALTPPADTMVAHGDTVRLVAEATDVNGHPVAGAEFAWASSDTLVAVVDGEGFVTGVGAGDVEVTATAAGVAGVAKLTVVAPLPTTIAVAPDTVILTWVGQTAQLTAGVRDQAGRVMDGIPVAWSSADTTVAGVDASGLVTAVSNGAVTVTAMAGEAFSDALVTVAIDLDRVALVALYNATDGPNWIDNTNWLTEAPLSEWYGVDTNAEGQVVRLDLSGYYERRVARHGLRGRLPSDLGNLTNLEHLNLRYNALSGSIPSEIGSLGNLTHLDLVGNELTGEIPPELGNIANLAVLLLGGNVLSGSIPSELGNSDELKNLYLAENVLSGAIPPELGNLAKLTSLGLAGNRLTGRIPPDLGKLASLANLQLQYNGLTGPIPQSFLQLDRLSGFYIRENDGLCVPGTSAFVAWLENIENRDESASSCNATDVGALESLFEATGGTDWTISAGWLGETALEEWYGVTADSLGHVTELDLEGNGLTGRLPAALGDMPRMTVLRIADNALSGRLPLRLTGLPLVEFRYSGTRLCAPPGASFQAWLNAIASLEGTGVSCMPLSDRDILDILYHETGGPSWSNNANWLTGAPLRDWYGVEVDGEGRVSELILGRNNLIGGIPPELGNLSGLASMSLSFNSLTGSIPSELGNLNNLTSLDLRFNNLTGSIPPELGKLGELTRLRLSLNDLTGPIPPELGDLANLTDLSIWDNNLTGPIPPELGHLPGLNTLDLADNSLTGPIPAELGNLADLKTLDLRFNRLTGAIPPELAKLVNLESLHLNHNNLTGSIPPELGNLAALRVLHLLRNNLTGRIPPALGNLTELTGLFLGSNNLTGPIPPALGNLANLTRLEVHLNNLTGPIPPALGNLTNLGTLFLTYNDLSGLVPPKLGELTNVWALSLAHNAGLTGALPHSLTALDRLGELFVNGTGLCAPADAAFQAWLGRVPRQRIALCAEGEPPTAYLTQAVQSREFPVPLVAGKKALLRVFPTARQATGEGIPSVRARFYLDGRETHVQDIPGKPTSIPTEVDEGSLAGSANAEIAGWVIQPGLEMVVEVDPDDTLDPALGVAKRIPETGRLAVDVRAMPPFDLTLIPFIWSETRDSSVVDLVEAAAADPEHHEMLADTRTLLPISALTVTAHEPVLSSSNNIFTLIREVGAIRVMEGGNGHYQGMMPRPVTGGADGLAAQPGRVSFSVPHPGLIAHELGHNLNLGHASCGGAEFPDFSYPHSAGSVGAWGYDFRDGGGLVHPSTPDLMSYCSPRWISDYHFSNALRFRLFVERAEAVAATSGSTQSLLLWGGVGADSVPYLEPAFVVDGPAALPHSAGDYRITGRNAAGGELFSLTFAMPVTADGDGSSSFAFALPVRPGWGGSLATITLSGPGGSVALDGETDIPIAILRSPQTGQVRGILRDPPLENEVAADVVGAAAPGLDVLFSRGIPGTEQWRR